MKGLMTLSTASDPAVWWLWNFQWKTLSAATEGPATMRRPMTIATTLTSATNFFFPTQIISSLFHHFFEGLSFHAARRPVLVGKPAPGPSHLIPAGCP